jgi:hypothetical protein
MFVWESVFPTYVIVYVNLLCTRFCGHLYNCVNCVHRFKSRLVMNTILYIYINRCAYWNYIHESFFIKRFVVARTSHSFIVRSDIIHRSNATPH